MKSKITLTLILLAASAIPISADEDTRPLDLAFDKEWVTYLLAEVGCPMPDRVIKMFSVDDCILTPIIDGKAKLRARKLAKQVFGFKE